MNAVTAALRARAELAAMVTAGTLLILDPPGPRSLDDLAGDDGDVLDVVWCQDSDRGAELDVIVFTGANPVNYDEKLRLEVVIQALRRGESATQVAADEAVETIWRYALGTLAGAPQIVDGGAADPTVDGIEAIVTGFRASGGYLDDGTGYGTRFEVELELEARFELS